MYQCCIFDLDGTLADTIQAIAYCGNQALHAIGFSSLEVEKYRYYAGDGADELLKRMLIDSDDTTLENFEALQKAYQESFSKHSLYRVKVFDGVAETLTLLKNKGIKLCVFSNKTDEGTKKMISYLFPDNFFDYVLGLKKGKERKPSPQGVDYILQKLHVNKEDCLYIGDTNTDMLTASNAKVKSVGVTWGFRNEEELRTHGATYIIHEAKELISICL